MFYPCARLGCPCVLCVAHDLILCVEEQQQQQVHLRGWGGLKAFLLGVSGAVARIVWLCASG